MDVSFHFTLDQRSDKSLQQNPTICVGALPVGKSGVLLNRTGTTYPLKDGYRQKELANFGVNVKNESILIDSNIITSYCPETGADVTFELLSKLVGKSKMIPVKEAMGYNP